MFLYWRKSREATKQGKFQCPRPPLCLSLQVSFAACATDWSLHALRSRAQIPWTCDQKAERPEWSWSFPQAAVYGWGAMGSMSGSVWDLINRPGAGKTLPLGIYYRKNRYRQNVWMFFIHHSIYERKQSEYSMWDGKFNHGLHPWPPWPNTMQSSKIFSVSFCSWLIKFKIHAKYS